MTSVHFGIISVLQPRLTLASVKQIGFILVLVHVLVLVTKISPLQTPAGSRHCRINALC